MLHQFFLDWNTAIQSRTIVKETKNPKTGIITFQQTKFTFHDHDIVMYSNIVSNTEHLPPERRRWMSELFVPSTNKIIPGTPFPTKTKCAIAILMALTEGREHEDRIETRNQARRQRVIKKQMQERICKLANTSFTDEEKKFIVELLYSREDFAAYADMLIEALVKYHNYITGRGLIECGINLGQEASLHINRMYGTVACLINESVVNKYNAQTLKYITVSKMFLAPRNNLSAGIYTIRSGLSKMYDLCKSPARFMHLVNLLAAYYENMTGVSLQEKIEIEKARLQRIREYRMNVGPNHKKGTPRNNVRVFSSNAAPVGATIGDVFGDVLDKVSTENETVVPKHYTKKKVKNAVTDGQINGKMTETPKEEPAVAEPSIAEQQKAFAEAQEEQISTEPQQSIAEAQREFAQEQIKEESAAEAVSDTGDTNNPVLPPDFALPAEASEVGNDEAPKAKRTRKTTKKTAAKEE